MRGKRARQIRRLTTEHMLEHGQKVLSRTLYNKRTGQIVRDGWRMLYQHAKREYVREHRQLPTP